ncbi:hypothetical protein WG902_02805 [Ramlibacter sp. PS3R-8]|uniref:hypothetical protein n=1 Tax=Ramlibacter sp. PS3R-8 TaxID=3133437 RepID=UPI0030AA6168
MHLSLTRLTFIAAAAVVLAGCASQSTQPAPVAAGSGGKHLVYRDGSGNLIRQFSYPDDAFCRRVEALAGRGARCQADPAPGFTAQATLRYNPPGVLVPGQYADLARCRADTSVMSAGVQLVDACAAR